MYFYSWFRPVHSYMFYGPLACAALVDVDVDLTSCVVTYSDVVLRHDVCGVSVARRVLSYSDVYWVAAAWRVLSYIGVTCVELQRPDVCWVAAAWRVLSCIGVTCVELQRRDVLSCSDITCNVALQVSRTASCWMVAIVAVTAAEAVEKHSCPPYARRRGTTWGCWSTTSGRNLTSSRHSYTVSWGWVTFIQINRIGKKCELCMPTVPIISQVWNYVSQCIIFIMNTMFYHSYFFPITELDVEVYENNSANL